MCRNITALRGLEPPATEQEVIDAARQFVRKVAGLTTPAQLSRDDVSRAIGEIARIAQELLGSLPPPRRSPVGLPSRRRRATDPVA